ncbi:MAG TPA: GWxTD domain-containing protein, partial [Vicinamibacteria bacterium]|nr:GWxTD domain-containing protein [Vicinamibacteria bacterium]
VAIALALGGTSSADERLENLNPEHRQWLEEEVVYIITDQERDLFLSLPTIQDREGFMAAFWERRDPDPATPANEFKDEHYERLDYANRIFSRDAPRPGWKTDMGRFWIILGKPHEIQRYDGLNDIVSTQVWFYNGDPKYGQPPRFNLVFFKPQDIGVYELYSPLGDGPEALLRAGSGATFRTDQNAAVDVLEVTSMDLARASLTVDLTEPVGNFLSARNSRQPLTSFIRVPINVDAVIANIEDTQRRRVSVDYLDAYLRYKDKVTADYSFRFVPSRQYMAVLVGPERTPFVHYSLELSPENFSLQANDEGTGFYTTLDVTAEVRDMNGNLMALSENSPYLELTSSQMQSVASLPFAYHDAFPLLPGDYRLSLILRNRATKQFTAAESELRVEAPPSGPAVVGLLIGYKTELTGASGGSDLHRTFQIGPEIVYPAIDGTFTPGETAYAMVQTWNAPPSYRLRLSLSNESSPATLRERDVSSYEGRVIIEAFSLSGLESGAHRLRAELLNESGQAVSERVAELTVSPRTSIPRAGFVYRHSFNTENPGLLALTRGQQHMVRGEIAEAESAYRQTVEAGNPSLIAANWKLATVFLYLGKPDDALALLTPLAAQFSEEPEVIEGLGLAYYQKQNYAEAVSHLERAITLRPPDYTLLNALGDSYQNLGDAEKAREVFERSLQLNPSQEAVKARIDALARSQ